MRSPQDAFFFTRFATMFYDWLTVNDCYSHTTLSHRIARNREQKLNRLRAP